jgi:thermostable 8-oxoguanine DNA glycosylase
MPTEPPTARITRDFVDEWRAHYSDEYDTRVLEEIHPAVAERNYFTRDEFLEVCRWKTRRVNRLVAENSDEDIEDITRLAFSAPERLRHRLLQLLTGVGVPVASALLTVRDPAAFTVIDFRSLHALRAHGELGERTPAYYAYVQLCRSVAQRVDVDLRALDRALWQWSKNN